MSTSLSSRRQFAPEVGKEALGGAGISIVACAAGVVLTGIAIKTGSALAAAPGFVGIAGSLMYWNVKFWSALDKGKK